MGFVRDKISEGLWMSTAGGEISKSAENVDAASFVVVTFALVTNVSRHVLCACLASLPCFLRRQGHSAFRRSLTGKWAATATCRNASLVADRQMGRSCD